MGILNQDGLLWYTHEYPDDWVAFNHEPWVPDYLLNLLPEGGVFLDIGAHVGRYSIRLADKASQVLAIEPFPSGLFAHVVLNNKPNVQVFRCAAWNTQSRLKSEGWGGSTRLVESEDGPILAEPLDEMQLPYADLVKIDVEGAEALVLQGARNYLKTAKPALFIEMHDETYLGIDRSRVYSILESLGYGYCPVGHHNEQWYLLAEHGSKVKDKSVPDLTDKWHGTLSGCEAADDTRLRVQWNYQGYIDKPNGGYGNVARSMMESLRDLGVDYDTLSRTLLYHTVPFNTFSWYPEQRAAILSMWEHTVLPEGIKAGLQLFDLAFPPCRFSADLFSPTLPCHIVPHGIDPAVYYPSEPRRRPQTLRILTSATNLRKGCLEVLEGLKKLPEDIPWTLSLKGKRAKEFDPGLPNVFIIDGEYDNLREIYQSHDLYVSGSKGEGWDLIAWEALACGVPTIVPAHSGYLEWGHLAQGWLTSFHMEPSLVKVFGDSGEWYVQDPEEIAKQVESLWQSYNESADEAYQNARQISREWTWQHAAAQLVLGLWEHGFDMTPLTESTDKQEYTPLVSIRATNSLIEGCDVGGYRLAPILEGVTYRVPGEVARVLQVAGYAELVA